MGKRQMGKRPNEKTSNWEYVQMKKGKITKQRNSKVLHKIRLPRTLLYVCAFRALRKLRTLGPSGSLHEKAIITRRSEFFWKTCDGDFSVFALSALFAFLPFCFAFTFPALCCTLSTFHTFCHFAGHFFWFIWHCFVSLCRHYAGPTALPCDTLLMIRAQFVAYISMMRFRLLYGDAMLAMPFGDAFLVMPFWRCLFGDAFWWCLFGHLFAMFTICLSFFGHFFLVTFLAPLCHVHDVHVYKYIYV